MRTSPGIQHSPTTGALVFGPNNEAILDSYIVALLGNPGLCVSAQQVVAIAGNVKRLRDEKVRAERSDIEATKGDGVPLTWQASAWSACHHDNNGGQYAP